MVPDKPTVVDAAGNLVSQTVPDPSGTTIGDTDYVYAYDTLGRRLCSTLPNGSGVVTTFGGFVNTWE